MASEDLGKDLISVNNLLKKHAVKMFMNIHTYIRMYVHMYVFAYLLQANSLLHKI